MYRRFVWVFAVLAVLSAVPAFAVTYFVPTDRDMVRRTDVIVVASVLSSYAQLTAAGGIETVTTLSVEEVIKGTVGVGQLELHEPGGAVGDLATIIPGVPRFASGQRVVTFLSRTPQGTWAVTDLALGKFTFVMDAVGRHLLTHDEGEINGWNPDGSPYNEGQRAADGFLDFLRTTARGGSGSADYYVTRLPLVANNRVEAQATRKPVANVFAASGYTADAGGGLGARWNSFPSSVTFYNENTEPGAQNGGVTAIQAALAAWTNDGGSNVSYVYGGADSGHTSGLLGPTGCCPNADNHDNFNTVQFERNLTAVGAAAFQCSANSYNGVLGIGGISRASGTHSYNLETFFTTQEGDVEMNQGIANCTLLLTTHAGDWNSALTHEIGHTLGFRHADQTRADNQGTPCSSDPSLECSGSAIMTGFVTNGLNASLALWDVHAVDAVYGSCTPPGISQQPQASPSTIASGSSSQLSVVATGTSPTYQWYVGSPGTTTMPVGGGTNSTVNVSPTTTTSYWVRITGSCGTIDSSGVTVTVTPCTPPSISTPAQANPTTIPSGNSSQLSVGGSGTATLTYQWYVGNPSSTASPVAGGTTASISVSPTITTTYWVRVSNGCGNADSAAVTVTVTCAAPNITQQPQASPASIPAGNSSQLSIIATGTSLSYQWYVGSSGVTTNPVAGGALATINVAPAATTTYWARVTGQCGTVDGRSVTVTVTAAQCAPPAISLQPDDQTVTPGTVNLFVGYTGSTSNVTWYQGAAPDTSHGVGLGQSLQIQVTSTTQFWAQVVNSCGFANSRTATITVTTVCTAPGISSATANPTTVAPAGASTLTVVATGTSLTYQWYRGPSGNTSNAISGATATSTIVNPSNTTTYWVRVSNSCGTADSSTITVTVSTSCTAPAVTTQPLSATITAGQKLTLSVIASGTSLAYQWYQGVVNDTSTPIGANDSNLTVQPLVNTSYWVKVTNSCGTAKSNAALIKANPSKHRAATH